MHTTNRQRNRSGCGLFLMVGFAFCTSSTLAQQREISIPAAQVPAPAVEAAQPAQQPQAGAGQTVQEAEAPQTLHLLVGRSLVITSPTRVKRISLADPAIADAIVVTPNEVLVNGKAPGGIPTKTQVPPRRSMATACS